MMLGCPGLLLPVRRGHFVFRSKKKNEGAAHRRELFVPKSSTTSLKDQLRAVNRT